MLRMIAIAEHAAVRDSNSRGGSRRLHRDTAYRALGTHQTLGRLPDRLTLADILVVTAETEAHSS